MVYKSSRACNVWVLLATILATVSGVNASADARQKKPQLACHAVLPSMAKTRRYCLYVTITSVASKCPPQGHPIQSLIAPSGPACRGLGSAMFSLKLSLLAPGPMSVTLAVAVLPCTSIPTDKLNGWSAAMVPNVCAGSSLIRTMCPAGCLGRKSKCRRYGRSVGSGRISTDALPISALPTISLPTLMAITIP